MLYLSFFLSGLRWHLSGLSELPLEERLLLLLASEPSLLSFLEEEPAFPFCFLFLWASSFTRTYEHVVVEHLPQAQHSTAQSDLHETGNQVRADPSAKTQASRRTWREPAYSRALMQLTVCVLKTNEQLEVWPAYKAMCCSSMLCC